MNLNSRAFENQNEACLHLSQLKFPFKYDCYSNCEINTLKFECDPNGFFFCLIAPNAQSSINVHVSINHRIYEAIEQDCI